MSYSDTPEQADVIAWQGKRLVVGAFAGTGKTTTLRRFAEQNPDERMLYIAYNRAIRDEAEQKFPYHVTCKTSHQLAYVATGRFFASRLVSNLKVTDVARALNSKNWRMAGAVLYTLNHFICSADEQITAIHAPDEEELPDTERAQAVTASQRLWLMMTARQGDFPVTHDTYLKLYQLSRPDLSSRYSTLLFDEAQDANPVTSAIVLSQRCRVVLVGDRHQQIYRFRGADNAMDTPQLEHADRLWLTNSFRFGPEVANVANRLLALKGETHKVIGKGPQDRVVDMLPRTCGHRAVLHRTVCGVISTALNYSLAGKKVYWVGGMESYRVEELLDLYWLSVDLPERMEKNTLTQDYRDYAEYCQVAEETGDPEMKQAMYILDQFFPLPERLKTLRLQRVENERGADVTVCTAHRSKGLEWDVVALYDDFADILDPDMPVDRRDDELNLLYVAATRARRLLVPDPVIREILAQPPAEDILVRPTGGDINGTGDDTDESGEDRDVA
ncbi:ATP-dependent helicase [Salmonella enterica]|nr:ATP-dependent helicase [Salmonella enterica subsp. enterica serovar Infantis]EDB9283318.1 ATP-dependent helicase [Salmonella enterica]EBH3468598.1 ATP-dependent helicase [Salmonella enterica subsp. enterica serovar Infantis]EBH3485819.1 ATP-dependent helicase [Salmonella enterica subsp. enterica serovar Infantis]EBH3503782.1 ATP-dependent helicase [Salmonella enterica subsp. enterica serovar Infantis]